MFPTVLPLFIWINVCVASVDFTHSTLYDIYDFKGKDEVPIPKCDNGCLIFASTMGNGFVDSPSDYDPYAENLIIFDKLLDRNLSITDLSRKFEPDTLQKTPMIVSGPASISVLNQNNENETAWPIVLYVVENNKANAYSYEIYDGLNMKNKMVSPGTTTIMCAYPFSITAKESESPNSVIARLVGFDNVLDANGDACPVAYSTPLQSFNGFTLNIAGPIISLHFTEKTGVEIDASLQFPPESDLNMDGFITTGGWNGCKKPKSGGFQSFRSGWYSGSDIYMLDSNTDKYNVSLDFLPNLDKSHKANVYDVKHADKSQTITGYDEVTVRFDDTDFLQIVYNGLTGDQGFLLRYSSVALPRPPTTTSPTIPTTTSTTTTTTQATTTSSSRRIENTLLVTFVAYFGSIMI